MKNSGLWIAVLAVVLSLSACAPQSLGSLPSSHNNLEGSCPVDTARVCDVWGGNKFRKREVNCRCY